MKLLILGLLGGVFLLVMPGAALAVNQQPVISGFTVTIFATPVEANGITSDPAGNIYAIGQSFGVITKITPGGTQTVVTTLGGGGWVNIYFDPVSTDLFVTNFTLKLVKRVTLAGVTTDLITGLSGGPSGITGDPAGNIYVAEQGPANLILKLFPGGSGTIYSSSGLSNPDGINFGSDGKLYVGNRGTGNVTVVPVGGGAAVLLAAGLNQPFDALPDSNGNVYVPHPTLGTLSRIIPIGAVSTIGLGFHEPKNLAFDPSGNLFIADSSADTIYKVAGVDVPPPDATPPSSTTITSAIDGDGVAVADGGSTTSTAITVTFTGADDVTPPGELTFECSLNGDPFASCQSGTTFSPLAVGSYQLQVQALDAASNIGPVASISWTVLAAPDPDSDGDGVPDATDLCSGTPAGTLVDSDGCAVTDAFDTLVAEINNLVGPKGIRTSLLAKLNGVQTAIENGKDKVALNKLKAFVNHVKAQKGKKLTNEQARFFQELADLISAGIQGGP